MRLKLSRRVAAAFSVVAFPMVALAAAPEATTEFVFDLMDSARHERRIRDFKRAMARLDGEQREAAERMEVKERIVAELIASRRGFDDVVRQFLALSGGRPMALPVIPGRPSAGEEERAAFSVLSYVSIRGEPVGCALPRMTREYEARFGLPTAGK